MLSVVKVTAISFGLFLLWVAVFKAAYTVLLVAQFPTHEMVTLFLSTLCASITLLVVLIRMLYKYA